MKPCLFQMERSILTWRLIAPFPADLSVPGRVARLVICTSHRLPECTAGLIRSHRAEHCLSTIPTLWLPRLQNTFCLQIPGEYRVITRQGRIRTKLWVSRCWTSRSRATARRKYSELLNFPIKTEMKRIVKSDIKKRVWQERECDLFNGVCMWFDGVYCPIAFHSMNMPQFAQYPPVEQLSDLEIGDIISKVALKCHTQSLMQTKALLLPIRSLCRLFYFSCIVLAYTSGTLMNRNGRVWTVALFWIIMKECAMPHY